MPFLLSLNGLAEPQKRREQRYEKDVTLESLPDLHRNLQIYSYFFRPSRLHMQKGEEVLTLHTRLPGRGDKMQQGSGPNNSERLLIRLIFAVLASG
ncbi:MAG TPA: hypothetical protein VF783_04350 [Terriglobales bacterium]